MCKVSVITSVYNCEKFIGMTIESVLSQSLKDWEFIIINDNSIDNSAEVIKKYNDDRIIFINNNTNKGQCENLNYGISIAKGEYIARLDHDDICYKNRFEIQVKYMEEHPEIVLLGAWFDYLINDSIKKVKRPIINNSNEVRFSHSFFNYCFPHSSFMIRKSVIRENKILYGKFLYAEDYDLLLRMSKFGEIDYIHDALIAYRISSEQCTQNLDDDFKQLEINEIRNRFFDEMDFKYQQYLKKAICCTLRSKQDYRELINEIIKYSIYCKCYNKNSKCLQRVYKDICIRQAKDFINLYSYFTSPFKNIKWMLSYEGIGYIVHCLLPIH